VIQCYRPRRIVVPSEISRIIKKKIIYIYIIYNFLSHFAGSKIRIDKVSSSYLDVCRSLLNGANNKIENYPL
jgi:hypothetical protein